MGWINLFTHFKAIGVTKRPIINRDARIKKATINLKINESLDIVKTLHKTKVQHAEINIDKIINVNKIPRPMNILAVIK